VSIWIRQDVDIHDHPDLVDAAAEADGWVLVAWQTILRLAKGHGKDGWILAKWLTGAKLARYSLWGPTAAPKLDLARDALVRHGMLVQEEDGFRVPGWMRFQIDPRKANRERTGQQPPRGDGRSSSVPGTTGFVPGTTAVVPDCPSRQLGHTAYGTGRDGTVQDKNTPLVCPPAGGHPPSVSASCVESPDIGPAAGAEHLPPAAALQATTGQQAATTLELTPPEAEPSRSKRQMANVLRTQVADAWNSGPGAAGCPKADPPEIWPRTRCSAVDARLREHGIGVVTSVIRFVGKDGRYIPSGQRGPGMEAWCAELDWLMRPAKFQQALERSRNGTTPSGRAASVDRRAVEIGKLPPFVVDGKDFSELTADRRAQITRQTSLPTKLRLQIAEDLLDEQRRSQPRS